MELMQLEMFVAVVEERSFLRAAERVFRTQPAVSIGLRKLEEEIGVPLLYRSRRQSGRLTPRGEMLYEYASRILRLRNEMCSALKERENASVAILRVDVTWEVSLDWIQPETISSDQSSKFPLAAQGRGHCCDARSAPAGDHEYASGCEYLWCRT